jgi:hypothetical protein
MVPDLRHVAGSETVSFTPDLATERLVFRLWPNAEPYARWGARLTVGRVAVGGQALPVSRPDPTMLIVGRTLAAGESLTVSMKWSLALPVGHQLRLHGGSSIRLGTFIPLLAWEPGVGWAVDPAPQHTLNETWTSPAADFDVNVSAPRGLTVVASGEQVSAGHWRAVAVRDFALAVGHFSLVHATVALPNPVRITVAVERKSFTFPAKFLAATEAALRSYSTRYGPYPWSTYTVVVMRDFTHLAGLEYPTLIYLSPDGWPLAAHETAHQWFYSLVGNDQGRDPWLDEGLASWAETAVEPTQSLSSFTMVTIPPNGKGKLGQPMPYWDPLPFQDLYDGVYVQAVQALASLGTPQQVDCALRLYVQQNAYGIATPDKLLTALQQFFPDARRTLTGYGAIF